MVEPCFQKNALAPRTPRCRDGNPACPIDTDLARVNNTTAEPAKRRCRLTIQLWEAGMIWLLAAIAVVSIVLAGRAHSKRLDERDDLHARGFLNKSWRSD